MRYAVIWDVDDGESVPCGLVVDGPDAVQLILPEFYGLPRFVDEPKTLVAPDGAEETVEPGDVGYFEAVLIDLSYAFAVVEQTGPAPVPGS